MSEVQTPSVEVEAASLGWTPQDKFRGDPSKWVDAETFVRRGHEVMPLLKKNNERLNADLGAAKAELADLRAQVTAGNQTVKDLVEFQTSEVKRQVDAQIKRLQTQKIAATRAGDHELAADIETQLIEAQDDARDVQAPVKITQPTKAAPGAEGGVSPWAKAFADENSDWLGKDKRRTSLFMGIADELHTTKGLSERALLDAAKAEMEETLAPPPGPSKVEGHQGGGSGGGGGVDRPKTFSDLPSDAKSVCKSEARKFVGQGKAFKTEAEWQKHYADVYFAE